MLKTKEDIKAQKVKDGGKQMDLLDTAKDKKSQIKSQKFVTYSLLVTLALSCFFWGLTEIKKSIKTGKKFSINLPKLNLISPKNNKSVQPVVNISLENLIKNNINQDGSWSFYIASNQKIIYQLNSNQFSQTPDIIKKNLETLDQSTTNMFSSNLPQGLHIIENLVEGRLSLQSELLINLPSQSQILIISKNTGYSDVEKPISILKTLIPQIYWNTIQAD